MSGEQKLIIVVIIVFLLGYVPLVFISSSLRSLDKFVEKACFEEEMSCKACLEYKKDNVITELLDIALKKRCVEKE